MHMGFSFSKGWPAIFMINTARDVKLYKFKIQGVWLLLVLIIPSFFWVTVY